MKYKPYPKYKDSGIEWLGEIPEEWSKSVLKRNCIIVGRIGFRGYSTEDIVDEGEGAITISPSNMLKGNVDLNKCTYLSWNKYYESPEIMVFNDDILMVKTGSTYGKVAYVNTAFTHLTVNPQIMILKNIIITPKYLFYIVFSKPFQDLLKLLNTGSTIPTMTQEAVGSIGIPLPPQSGQYSIVNLLDRKTAQIDAMIEKKQRQIELLKEKRSTLITQAVTKGLDPNVKMKDSGIEWLGEIPENWGVVKLKYTGRVIIGLSYSPKDLTDEAHGTLLLRASNIQDGKLTLKDSKYVGCDIPEKLITRIGDILICSRSGSRDLIGKNCLITDNIVGLTFGVFMSIFRSKYWLYIYWVLNSTIFKSQAGIYLTTTINQLTISTLENLIIPIPPEIEEQNRIAHYIEKKTSRIDALIEKVKESIDKLKEYRSALITAAVTGKIDIRGN